MTEPLIVPRAEHSVSRKAIDAEALKVLYRLHNSGYRAFLVGGAVRDLLLGRIPKDYDVGTDATLPDLRRLFRNSRVIGRRFRIVHVFFQGGKVIEVTTFRRKAAFEEPPAEEAPGPPEEGAAPSGAGEEEPPPPPAAPPRTPSPSYLGTERGPGDKTGDEYGTPEEDAFRRDLTINGLFYDVSNFSVVDYVGGLKDLQEGVIRLIGPPDERVVEDPVRIIRVIRHAARTGFRIDPATWAAAVRHRARLLDCAPARVLEEFYREMRGGVSEASFRLALEVGVIEVLLPDLVARLRSDAGAAERFWKRLRALDELTRERGELPNCVLLGIVLAPLLEGEALEPRGGRRPDRAQLLQKTLRPILERLGVSRRDSGLTEVVAIVQQQLHRGSQQGGLSPSFRKRSYAREAAMLFEVEARAEGKRPPPFIASLASLPPAPRVPRRRRRRRGPRGEGEHGPSPAPAAHRPS